MHCNQPVALGGGCRDAKARQGVSRRRKPAPWHNGRGARARSGGPAGAWISFLEADRARNRARVSVGVARSDRAGACPSVVSLATLRTARLPRLGCTLRCRPLRDRGGSRCVVRSAMVAGAGDQPSSSDSRPSFGRWPLPSLGLRAVAPHRSRTLRRALRAVVRDRAATARRRRTAARCRHGAAGRASRRAGLAGSDCVRCAMRLGFRALFRKKRGARRRDARACADGLDGELVRRRSRRPALRVGQLRVQTAPGGAANHRNCGPQVTAGLHRSFEV